MLKSASVMQTLEMLRTFLIGILIPLVRSSTSECRSTEKCDCYNYNGEYEFQCPPANFSFVLHTRPGEELRLDCTGLREFDLDVFPDVRIGDITNLYMQDCPLPKISFRDSLQKFDIRNINYMELNNCSTTLRSTIAKELFEGLSELNALSLTLFTNKFNMDFLQGLSNLEKLYLDKNEIKEVDYNMFKYTPKLRVLHLSRNRISQLPDGLFRNMSDLQQLHLWSNELITLSKETFTGLNELKSLELSNNKIMSLDEDTFSELVELVNISLRSNNLSTVSSRIFRTNIALQGVRIGNNPRLNLSDYVFANLPNLTNVNIANSNLKKLPEHLFEGSVSLSEISLTNNFLADLPESIFKDLTKLKSLYLDKNKLSHLPDGIFSSLKGLENLSLEGNQLTEINEKIFKSTQHLKALNLRNNRITTIYLNGFSSLKKLNNLDLSYNRFTLNYGENVIGLDPFNHCENLRKLNLSHNQIDSFPEGIISNKVDLEILDLNYNIIQYVRVAALIKVSNKQVDVFLNNNNISVIDFRDMKAYARANMQSYDAAHNNDYSTVVYIEQNPIRCDCSNFDLIQYNNDNLNPVIKTVVDIEMNNLHCATPKAFEHIPIKDLKPYHITCPLRDVGCPTECFCEYRPYDKCVVVNCMRRNLTEPPIIRLDRSIKLDNVEVHLEDNSLEVAPYSGLGYENVTELCLSNNLIKSFNWVPPKIKVLMLNNNKLANIETKMIHILNETTTLKNLTLYGNPWACGCSAASLQNYLRNHFTKVNPNDVICEDNKQLIEKKELCKSYMAVVMAIAMPILIIVCVAAVVTALYFYYQQEIKVWLYAKNLCLWFVTEEELDKDKIYDVFIIIQNLLPVLESGPNPFKICIHIRDWVPGEFIATQVTKSVLDSRRTLVLLSENFLESVWGKMEFRTAHTQAINEGRARVVVIKYGKLNEETLDDELKAYLKMNTYVEWGDPWFWNKLKYALPHSRQNKFYNNNQKHANIMLKIDDKFELVSSSPTIHVESTPPVMSLDPALLKNHPLNFKSTENIATPPAEAPLM
ncbi:hypothetical protein NQ318_020956, partial [Aromia moschata]